MALTGKFGVFNTVIGYESFDPASNPNYTRSWGWAVEPTEHTGILGAYKITTNCRSTLAWPTPSRLASTTSNNYNNSNGSPGTRPSWVL